jgi:hypothetical protein
MMMPMMTMMVLQVMRFTATLKLPVVKFASGVETVVER